MVCGLFSVFDPGTLLKSGDWFDWKWVSSLLVFLFMNWNPWKIQSGPLVILKTLFVSLWTSGGKNCPLGFHLAVSVMLTIYSFNLLGLLSLPVTAHLSWTLPMGLLLWMAGVLMSWRESKIEFLAHLLPKGTPTLLWMFIVMIEIVSTLIRPLTLSVRLAANVMASHVLMALLAHSFHSLSLGASFMVCLVINFFIVGVEVVMYFLQALVFSMLVVSYWEEIPVTKMMVRLR